MRRFFYVAATLPILYSAACSYDYSGVEDVPQPAQGLSALEVEEVSLEEGDLEVIGTGIENAIVTVDGCNGLSFDVCGCPSGNTCIVIGQADAEGAFDITTSSFASPTCTLLVSDGVDAVRVENVPDCEPLVAPAPAPAPDPGNNPAPAPDPGNNPPPAPAPPPAPEPDPIPPPAPLPPPAVNDLIVEEAILDEGELEVLGESPIANAHIIVDGCAGVPLAECGCPAGNICYVVGISDAEGAFDVTADNFASPSCTLLVSDETNTTLVNEVEGCEPVVAPPPGAGEIVVDEALLEEGDLEVVGETTTPDARIVVDGCAGVPLAECGCPAGNICQAVGVADDEGAFDVLASNFASPSCTLLVSDGVNSTFVNEVEGCEPVVAPPPGAGEIVVEEAALEEGSLDVIGETTSPNARIVVDGCAGVPLAQCGCPAGNLCQVVGVADADGAFEVTAENFASPNCTLLVSDGTNSTLVDEVEGCEPL